jgi:acyl-CoA synthetase (AMP-forming)/AMP-acid ligase II
MAPDGIPLPHTLVKRLLEQGAGFAGDAAHALKVLIEAGIVRPHRPDRALLALKDVVQRGITPAAGYGAAASLYPDEPGIVDELGILTFGEIRERTTKLANALHDAGVGEGDGVAVLARNHRYFVESIVALSKLGANALMLNTGHSGPQISDVLDREGPSAIIYDGEFAEILSDVLEEDYPAFVAWSDDDDEEDATHETLEQLIEKGSSSGLPVPSQQGRTTILTSGTTGTPKGASRGTPGVGAAVAILSRIPVRARQRVLVSAPLFHQWGFAWFQLGMLLGSTLVLRRKFTPEDALDTIQREGVNTVVMVPVMTQRILELGDDTISSYDTSSVTTVCLSGSALPPAQAEKLLDTFGDVVYSLYGSTEVAWVAIAGPEDLREHPSTAGPPPRGTSIKIFDDDEQELPVGETGRIFVGNDELFEGYTGGGSKDMLDGHMSTGDVGHLDEDGRLYVEGRDDDMIVSGGENVFPQEVEETLGAHENVAEAAVVGVEDEKFGQALKAYVVKNGEVDADTLKSHVKSNLAGFKVPRDIEFIDELPRNAAGKVVKGELPDDDEG